MFPAGEQEGARNVLAESLQAIVSQQLLPKVGGGRVAALEIVFATPAISNLIRRGKTAQITSLIQGGVKQGMIDMDGSIRALYEEGIVTARAAYDKAVEASPIPWLHIAEAVAGECRRGRRATRRAGSNGWRGLGRGRGRHDCGRRCLNRCRGRRRSRCRRPGCGGRGGAARRRRRTAAGAPGEGSDDGIQSGDGGALQ